MKVDDQVVAHRHQVSRTTTVSFIPDEIDIAAREQVGKPLTTSELGGTCRGHFGNMPKQLCAVLWEHKSLPGHILQPVRPKLLLLTDLRVPPGQALQLQ